MYQVPIATNIVMYNYYIVAKMWVLKKEPGNLRRTGIMTLEAVVHLIY